MPPAGGPPSTVPWGAMLVVTLVFVLILVTGTFYYSWQEQDVTSRVTGDLKSITKLKVDQIVSWREDRLSDARGISTSSYLLEGIDTFLAENNTADRDRILQRFSEINMSRQYANILLTDSKGSVRLSLDPSALNVSQPAREAVVRSLAEGRPVMTDLHMKACKGTPVMDVVAPLVLRRENGSTENIGAVVLAIDPDEYLYPFIRSWPVPSDSAETLLVERQGDNVVWLNNLRYQNNTALNLTLPLTRTDVPAVMAVLGKTGVFTGTDYRGVEVISVLEPVTGSPWFIVAKVDTTEAYGPWRTQSGLIIILFIGILTGAVFVTGFLWQRRQKYYYQTLYEADKARQEYRRILEGVLDTISVRVFWKDNNLVYLGCNAPFARDAGYESPADLIGKDDYAMAWGGRAELYRADDRAVIDTGRLTHLYEETVTISTGETINVLTSKVPLKDDNGTIIGVLGTYLDITAYKRTEEALRVSEQHLRKSQEVAHLGSWELDIDSNKLTWSDETYRIFGLQPQEFTATFEAFLSFVHPDDRNAVETAYTGSVAEGKDSYEIEHRIVQPGTGQVRVVHEKCDHVRNPAGRIIRSIGVVQDITELRKADEEFRQSEERFRTLVDLSPVAMLVSIGVEEKVEFINRRFTELFGYTIRDVPDVAHWWPLAYPDERYRQEVGALWTERVEEAVRNHAETGPVETEVTCRDGTKRFVEFRLVSIGSKNLVFATDLTGHKAAMDEIRSSKAFLDNVIDMSPFAMWISDREGTVFRVNRSLCDTIRLRPEDIVLKYNVFHDENLKKEGVMPKVKEVFENQNAARFSIPWRAADAGTSDFSGARDMFIDVSMFPIADAQGRLTNVVCQWVDITDRRRAEEALRQSEHRVQTLLKAIPDMMFMITRDGTFRDYRMPEGVVPAVPPDHIIGTNVRDSGFGAATTAAILGNIAKALDSRNMQVFDYQLDLPQGPRQYEARLVALGHDEVLGIVRDITERKKAEHERETLIRDLEQKNAELERFTYTVSHDLKSPLITIKGFAGMLEDDAQKRDAVQLKKDVRRITDAADIMQDLLNDVLELSRIGRIVSPPEMTEFGTIAREAAGLLAGPIAERGVTVEIAPGLPAVNVDRSRIREVMVNLIENAVKYMGSQPDPVIRIGAEYDSGVPVFFVQDNGIGIERRYIDRIFNLFEKLDPSTPGTGVGLTIVKRIIEVHGGKVWADSGGAGKGTTIRFTLPGPEEQGGG